jgi:endonuclease/exonuclease/phosphatase family metal-dependent hydrolase
VARTVNAYGGYGPDSRIDRVYATGQLLPALLSIDVVEVPECVSDHHIVRVQLDGGVLADILNAQPQGSI